MSFGVKISSLIFNNIGFFFKNIYSISSAIKYNTPTSARGLGILTYTGEKTIYRTITSCVNIPQGYTSNIFYNNDI